METLGIVSANLSRKAASLVKRCKSRVTFGKQPGFAMLLGFLLLKVIWPIFMATRRWKKNWQKGVGDS